MDENPAPLPQKEHVIDWRLLGRRAKKPTPWIALIVVLGVSFLLLEAYLWQPAKYTPDGPEERFRFDSVYMVERGTEGNLSTFAVSPWFSNPSREATRDIHFVIYAIETNRRIATSVGSADIGDLPSMRTQNTSIEFRLNNTKDYSIEILVLEGDYLIARGYGSVGWIHYYGHLDAESSSTSQARYFVQEPGLRSGDFVYEYPGR